MRIKRGLGKHKRHKKILAQTKGYRLSYSKLYKRSREAVMHAGQYSFAHRKKRTAQFRGFWIQSLGAALQTFDLKYNKFIAALKAKNITLNRKVMAEIAELEPKVFAEIVKVSR